MHKVLGTIWVFITYQLFAGFMYYQHGYDDSAFSLFYKHQTSAPLLLLQVGMCIYIAMLVVYLVYVKAHADSDNELPVLFVEGITKPLKRFWEIVSLFAVAVVPWIGFIWMWIKFHDARQLVWEKQSPQNVYGLYDKVSSPFSFWGNWDNYRYGRVPDGDSFVPFWQQVFIMIPLSIIGLVLTAMILKRALRILRKV